MINFSNCQFQQVTNDRNYVILSKLALLLLAMCWVLCLCVRLYVCVRLCACATLCVCVLLVAKVANESRSEFKKIIFKHVVCIVMFVPRVVVVLRVVAALVVVVVAVVVLLLLQCCCCLYYSFGDMLAGLPLPLLLINITKARVLCLLAQIELCQIDLWQRPSPHLSTPPPGTPLASRIEHVLKCRRCSVCFI